MTRIELICWIVLFAAYVSWVLLDPLGPWRRKRKLKQRHPSLYRELYKDRP